MKTFLFLPAYALLMIGFFVYPHHPPLSRAARANHHSVLHILSLFIRTCTCKTIRSQNILYFTFWLFLSAPFPLVPLLLQNHPFTKHTVFHILSVFHTFKSLTITRQKKPRTHPSYNKCNQILFYIVKVSLSRFDPYFIHISHIYCLPVQCTYVRNMFFFGGPFSRKRSTH